MKYAKITDEKRKLIILNYTSNKLNKSEISKLLNVAKSTVRNIIAKYELTGEVTPSKKGGSRGNSKLDRRILHSFSERNFRKSS